MVSNNIGADCTKLHEPIKMIIIENCDLNKYIKKSKNSAKICYFLIENSNKSNLKHCVHDNDPYCIKGLDKKNLIHYIKSYGKNFVPPDAEEGRLFFYDGYFRRARYGLEECKTNPTGECKKTLKLAIVYPLTEQSSIDFKNVTTIFYKSHNDDFKPIISLYQKKVIKRYPLKDLDKPIYDAKIKIQGNEDVIFEIEENNLGYFVRSLIDIEYYEQVRLNTCTYSNKTYHTNGFGHIKLSIRMCHSIDRSINI